MTDNVLKQAAKTDKKIYPPLAAVRSTIGAFSRSRVPVRMTGSETDIRLRIVAVRQEMVRLSPTKASGQYWSFN